MQDLSGAYPLKLCPTSQEGGNLVQGDLAEAAMTAPGSPPVTPLPPPLQQSHPDPQPSGPQQPVGTPARRKASNDGPIPYARPAFTQTPARRDPLDTGGQPLAGPKWDTTFAGDD